MIFFPRFVAIYAGGMIHAANSMMMMISLSARGKRTRKEALSRLLRIFYVFELGRNEKEKLSYHSTRINQRLD